MASFITSQMKCARRWMFLQWNEFYVVYCAKKTFPLWLKPCRFGDGLHHTGSRYMASYIVSQMNRARIWTFLQWNEEFQVIFSGYRIWTFVYRFQSCRFGDGLCGTGSRYMASFIVNQMNCARRWMFLQWNAEFYVVYCAIQKDFPISLSRVGLATVCAVQEVELWRPMLLKGYFWPELYIRLLKFALSNNLAPL